MNKKIYTEPIIEVVKLEKNDFIVMSNETDFDWEDDLGGEGGTL